MIVPCYNEEETVRDFYNEFIKNDGYLKNRDIDFELIFVNDGSKDDTVVEVKKLHDEDERVHLISFSRNFGKESAMIAGLEQSRGDYIVIMDVDLQDPPSLIPEMFSRLDEGYDSVATRRVTRKGEPPIRSFFARCFYKLMRIISKTEIVDGARDYRLMTRQMVDAIISMKECNRFTKGIYGWVGFDTYWIEYENIERSKGETKWNFWKLFLYSIDGIVAFSTMPLSLSIIIGFISSLAGFISLITSIFVNTANLLLIGVISLLSGIQLIFIGILGLYLSKTYLEVKDRPIYIVKEII